MILRTDKLPWDLVRPKKDKVNMDAWDDLVCLVRPSLSFIGRAMWRSLGLGVFRDTINCPLVHMDRLKDV